jgi:hypothetical protein
MSKIIVVAINQNFSDSFISYALETARHCDARIVAVHVVDLTTCYAGWGDSNYGLVVDVMQAYGRATLARAMATLGANERGAEARLLTLPVSGSRLGREIATVCEASGARHGEVSDEQATSYGNCWDNSPMERLFRSLKTEWCHRPVTRRRRKHTGTSAIT